MAEIIQNQNTKKSLGFARQKIKSIHIDMTPMVDLGFLLITFFIFTSAMKSPAMMSLVMPNETGSPTPIKESGAFTIIPRENGLFSYYEGALEKESIHTTSLIALRNKILQKKRSTPEKSFVVVIKPSDQSNYKQVVDILDEMTISQVKKYVLTNISNIEKNLLN